MASASLNKMTVPLASDQSPSAQGLLMPKLKYRFRVTLQNFGASNAPNTELTKQVVNVTRPNLTFEEMTLPIYNSTLKLAGKYTWNNITLAVRDDASHTVATLVGAQLQKQFDFAEMASASSGIDYKFAATIEILDGGNGKASPVVLETWNLYGCYLQAANYGDLNYGTSEAAQIELTIVYDNAAQYGGASPSATLGGEAGGSTGRAVAGKGGSVTGVGGGA